MAQSSKAKQVRSCWHHLSLLARPSSSVNSAKSRNLKRAILADGGACLTQVLVDIIHNLLRNNCPLDDTKRRLLKRHKAFLLRVVRPNTSLKNKQRLLGQQIGGGLITSLVLAALPVLVDLIFPKRRRPEPTEATPSATA